MNISFKESFYVKKIPNKSGSFGYLAKHRHLEDNMAIKIVNNLALNKEAVLKSLLSKDYINESGYPVDTYEVDNVTKGYIIRYFDKSHTFDYCITRDNFTHNERVKASIDCSKQLKQLHSYGFLFNDISSKNQLIDEDSGHLIDFDAATKGKAKLVETSFNLSLNGRTLLPSQNLDKLKQALVNLSLIYQIDIEELIANRSSDVNTLFSIFKDNKEVYKLLYSYLSCDDTKPYFDILENYLQDEEKVAYDRATVYKKTLTLI